MKSIKGYEGRYSITKNGNVYSHKNKKFLTNCINEPNGYYIVNLCANKQQKIVCIHKLIAKAFIPNPESKPIVNHIDGNKLNNDISNLEWVTYAEDTKHAIETGLREMPSNNPGVSKRKLTIEQAQLARKLFNSGKHNQRELVAMFNVKFYIIRDLIKGKTYKEE